MAARAIQAATTLSTAPAASAADRPRPGPAGQTPPRRRRGQRVAAVHGRCPQARRGPDAHAGRCAEADQEQGDGADRHGDSIAGQQPGNRDSGGPTYAAITQYTDLARGTLTAVDPNAPATCTGYPGGNGRICSWRIWFEDITNELSDFSVSVITEP